MYDVKAHTGVLWLSY